MSYFTKKVVKTYEFEDDVVSVEMRRLKKKDAIKLAPMLGEPDEDGTFKIKFSDSIGFMGSAGVILMSYVDRFEGLKDADGNAISLQDVCGEEEGESYFLSLVSEMFSDLMECSFAKSKKDEKKLEGQQDDTLKASSSTEASVSAELE